MILDKIVAAKKIRIEKAKADKSLSQLIKDLDRVDFAQKKSFQAALAGKDKLSVIAEVKKASPSKGLISADFDYLQIAQNYEENGASAVSVLTEEDFFLGSDEILQDIRAKINLPILRKDFMVDEYQICQSKLLQADCILLIMRILSDEQVKRFYALASELGLDVLFETHNETEIDRAMQSGAKIIGVNNRDLDTFVVDIAHSEKLIASIPSEFVRVSESGIKTAEDMVRLRNCGFDAVLVGETLMRAKNTSDIKKILG